MKWKPTAKYGVQLWLCVKFVAHLILVYSTHPTTQNIPSRCSRWPRGGFLLPLWISILFRCRQNVGNPTKRKGATISRNPLIYMVAREGVEPPTRGFSVNFS